MKSPKVFRLVPDEPFPPYAYIPTRFPHPVRDPKGHSYGKGRAHSHAERGNEKKLLNPQHWQKCRPYLYGIDLFNHGYYWEAHDAWESVWLACGRKGVTADFLKGLIKLAAAGVKTRGGKPSRVQTQARRAKELFHSVSSQLDLKQRWYMGLSLVRLVRFADRLVQRPKSRLRHLAPMQNI